MKSIKRNIVISVNTLVFKKSSSCSININLKTVSVYSEAIQFQQCKFIKHFVRQSVSTRTRFDVPGNNKQALNVHRRNYSISAHLSLQHYLCSVCVCT